MRDPIAFILRIFIFSYRYTLSAFIGRNCRFAPSCSEYGLEAIEKYGGIKGGHLAIKRILRCNPWGGHGYDPVPDDLMPDKYGDQE